MLRIKQIILACLACGLVGTSATSVLACTSEAKQNIINYLVNKGVIKQIGSTDSYQVVLKNSNGIQVKTAEATFDVPKLMAAINTAALNYFGYSDTKWNYHSYLDPTGQTPGGLAINPLKSDFGTKYLDTVSDLWKDGKKEIPSFYDWYLGLKDKTPYIYDKNNTPDQTIAFFNNTLPGAPTAEALNQAIKKVNANYMEPNSPHNGPTVYQTVSEVAGAASKISATGDWTASVDFNYAYLYFGIFIGDDAKKQVVINLAQNLKFEIINTAPKPTP